MLANELLLAVAFRSVPVIRSTETAGGMCRAFAAAIMEQRTHERTSERYVGRPVTIEDGRAIVELETTEEMAVDEHDLVHGGFVFGAADYAAMLAVNEPTVVLIGAETSFTAPTTVGDTIRATATVEEDVDGIIVECAVKSVDESESLMNGTFECAVPSKHVVS